jgi:hypothetical protein
MAKVFREYIEAGKIRQIDPRVTGQSFVHAIWGAFVDALLSAHDDERKAGAEPANDVQGYVTRAVQYLLAGVRS